MKQFLDMDYFDFLVAMKKKTKEELIKTEEYIFQKYKESVEDSKEWFQLRDKVRELRDLIKNFEKNFEMEEKYDEISKKISDFIVMSDEYLKSLKKDKEQKQ